MRRSRVAGSARGPDQALRGDARPVKQAAPVRSAGYCSAFVRLPMRSRTPGSGSRFQRSVMNFRIEPVS